MRKLDRNPQNSPESFNLPKSKAATKSPHSKEQIARKWIMSEAQAREAFIETILAEPSVESHRLIYADWLEERGELHKAEGLRTLPGLAGVWSSDWGQDRYGTCTTFTIKDVGQKMRWIAPGTFSMGSPEEEEGRYDNEGPRHLVKLTQGFWLADTPCTQEMWQVVMGDNPSHFQGIRRPVEYVDFSDCRAFCEQVGTLVRGLELVLPTEAQWEYACRAGTEGARYHHDIDAIAWYKDNSGNQTHPVAKKEPNLWGLYDVLGNVYEWCQDGLRDYVEERVTDPVGPTDEPAGRVIRGGSWLYLARSVRAAYRHAFHPVVRNHYVGFRCSSSG